MLRRRLRQSEMTAKHQQAQILEPAIAIASLQSTASTALRNYKPSTRRSTSSKGKRMPLWRLLLKSTALSLYCCHREIVSRLQCRTARVQDQLIRCHLLRLHVEAHPIRTEQELRPSTRNTAQRRSRLLTQRFRNIPDKRTRSLRPL